MSFNKEIKKGLVAYDSRDVSNLRTWLCIRVNKEDCRLSTSAALFDLAEVCFITTVNY